MSSGKGFAPRLFKFIHTPIVVALVLAIIGGTKSFDNNIDSQNLGRTLTKVAVLLFLFGLIALATVAFVTLFKIGHVVHGERKLVSAAVTSIPFLFVRMVYSIVVAFSSPDSKVFSLVSDTKAAVIVQAFMAVAEEFAVVTIYLLAVCSRQSFPGVKFARTRRDINSHRTKTKCTRCRGEPPDDWR